MKDYGYQFHSHVIDYYLAPAIATMIANPLNLRESKGDWDIENERREGWGYAND